MSDALRGHLFITSVERAARLRFDGRLAVAIHAAHFVFPKTPCVNTHSKLYFQKLTLLTKGEEELDEARPS